MCRFLGAETREDAQREKVCLLCRRRTGFFQHKEIQYHGRAFVITQSIKKRSDVLKEAVYNDYDHRPHERIVAHFMIGHTALLIQRLLENKLDSYGSHFTTSDIIGMLKNMNVINMKDVLYTAAYSSSRVCTALNGVFGLGLDKKNYQPKELNKKSKIFPNDFPCYISKSHQGRKKRRGYAGYVALGFLSVENGMILPL